jgi:hypothetical protein
VLVFGDEVAMTAAADGNAQDRRIGHRARTGKRIQSA